MSDRVHYPFKTLANIFERDAPFNGKLEPYHEALDSIKLHLGVPVPVQQLLETAKNISLYAFYAYRLHQPAELIGYSALEMAFRERVKPIRPELFANPKKYPKFNVLCDLVVKYGWLKPEGFSHLQRRAYQQVRYNKMIELTKRMEAEGLSEAEEESPTDEEVSRTLKGYTDFANPLLKSIRELRNELAHGSPILMPSSIRTLDLLAEAINQLFPEP